MMKERPRKSGAQVRRREARTRRLAKPRNKPAALASGGTAVEELADGAAGHRASHSGRGARASPATRMRRRPKGAATFGQLDSFGLICRPPRRVRGGNTRGGRSRPVLPLSSGLEIDRRSLALLTALEVEAHLLALMQAADPGALHRGDMDEDIFRT